MNNETGKVRVTIEVGDHLGRPGKKYATLFVAPINGLEGDYSDGIGAMVTNTLLKHFGVVELLDEVQA